MSADERKPWYSNGLRFQCTRCGTERMKEMEGIEIDRGGECSVADAPFPKGRVPEVEDKKARVGNRRRWHRRRQK